MRKHFSFRFIRKYLILTQILFICAFVTYINYGNNFIKQRKYYHPVNLTYVTVHLDMKGAPLKMQFMMKMLPELKMLGANALLMEYEDMFPYQNQLGNLSKPLHYSRYELTDFLIKANDLGLEIIPLIQTFGHMESVLKLSEFKHLREDTKFMDSICPSKLDTRVLINEMLKQVIEFHNSIVPLKHIHIGCDEVFKINICGDCKTKNLSTRDIFINHINTVTNMVLNLSPDTSILIWDDMLRNMKIIQWQNFKMNPKVEIAYWWYNNNILKSTHTSMYFYHKHFQNIWVASAYKGADGKTAATPDYEKRTVNTLGWLRFIENYVFAGERKVYSFKGIILTGWSRYKHFYPLCELLPVSYKSLVTGLLLVNKFKNGSRTDDINWEEDWNTVFNKHFLTDYYKHVGCKVVNSCILESANSLYNALERYEFFMQNLSKQLSLNESWCNLTYYELIRNFEDDLRLNMKTFYSLEDQDEFIEVRRHSIKKMYPHLAKCLSRKKTTIKKY